MAEEKKAEGKSSGGRRRRHLTLFEREAKRINELLKEGRKKFGQIPTAKKQAPVTTVAV